MSGLVEFLNARLDADERAARAATAGPWRYNPEKHHHEPGTARFSEAVFAGSAGKAATCVATTGESDDPQSMADAAHIARHDPARVLAEVAGKRRIIALHTPDEREPETDEQLHARFAHPEWEYATTEGQRKAWTNDNVPPVGDDGYTPDPTWERNVDAGIPGEGWERFDYTEESYWRRRLPADQIREPYVPAELKLLALPYANYPDYDESWRP